MSVQKRFEFLARRVGPKAPGGLAPGQALNATIITIVVNPKLNRSRGFVLWEVMLALTIFCVVAVALTTALQQTVDVSIMLRDESQVRLEIQNLLDETAAMKLKPGKSELQVGDGRVRYEREIRAVQARTAMGDLLPNLYEIKVQASWRSSGQDRSESAALIVYQP
ncbi:MAG: type II secretion system protein [Verrucomicrobia bacterium]|nr:type II secretion system protein [Verrucomicrobiota bacterium]